MLMATNSSARGFCYSLIEFLSVMMLLAKK